MFECSLTNSYINNQNNAMIRYARDFWEFYWNLIFFLTYKKLEAKPAKRDEKPENCLSSTDLFMLAKLLGWIIFDIFFLLRLWNHEKKMKKRKKRKIL